HTDGGVCPGRRPQRGAVRFRELRPSVTPRKAGGRTVNAEELVPTSRSRRCGRCRRSRCCCACRAAGCPYSCDPEAYDLAAMGDERAEADGVFGTRLKQARDDAGLSTLELAEKLFLTRE